MLNKFLPFKQALVTLSCRQLGMQNGTRTRTRAHWVQRTCAPGLGNTRSSWRRIASLTRCSAPLTRSCFYREFCQKVHPYNDLKLKRRLPSSILASPPQRPLGTWVYCLICNQLGPRHDFSTTGLILGNSKPFLPRILLGFVLGEEGRNSAFISHA